MNKKSRIVVVVTGVPENVGGAPIRNYQILKGLCERPNTDVDLFCICVERRFAAKKKQLEDDLPVKTHFVAYRWATVFTKLYAVFVARMQPHMVTYRRLTGLGESVWRFCEENEIDAVHIEQMDAYYCMEPYIAALQNKGIKIILDEHNIETDVLKGTSEGLKFPLNIVGKTMVGSLRKLEKDAVVRANAVLACSDVDAAWFRDVRGDDEVYVVPNGVDCDEFLPSTKKQPNRLIFVGSPGYPPNADALGYYLRSIHPKVRSAIPEVRLDIIGRDSEEWLEKQSLASDETVIPHGFVPSVSPYLDAAAVGICPVRAGSGTRLKVLTYMSAGIPVVSTTKGAEGIGYTDSKDVLIADTEIQFANAVVSLLRDKKLRAKIGGNARLLMHNQYDWKMIRKALRSCYERVI